MLSKNTKLRVSGYGRNHVVVEKTACSSGPVLGDASSGYGGKPPLDLLESEHSPLTGLAGKILPVAESTAWMDGSTIASIRLQ